MKEFAPFQVLYADDNEDARFLVATTLSFSGIEVIAAGTIADAWGLARSESFDLYLLDSQFPDGSGLDLCRSLREYTPSTPIVFYSGHAFKTDIKNGLAAGADAYLIKPYIADLTVTIQQIIRLPKKAINESYNNYPTVI